MDIDTPNITLRLSDYTVIKVQQDLVGDNWSVDTARSIRITSEFYACKHITPTLTINLKESGEQLRDLVNRLLKLSLMGDKQGAGNAAIGVLAYLKTLVK